MKKQQLWINCLASNSRQSMLVFETVIFLQNIWFWKNEQLLEVSFEHQTLIYKYISWKAVVWTPIKNWSHLVDHLNYCRCQLYRPIDLNLEQYLGSLIAFDLVKKQPLGSLQWIEIYIQCFKKPKLFFILSCSYYIVNNINIIFKNHFIWLILF